PSARKVISFGGATYAATFLALLTDSTKVELLADRIAAVATAKGTDVDIDAEFPQNDAQAKGLAQLITRLAEKLPKGRVYFAAPTLYDVDHTVSHPDVQAAVLNHPNIYINIFGYDLTRTPNPAAGDPGYTKGSCLWDDGSQAQVQWFPTRDGAGKTGRLSVEYLVDYIADRLTETAPSRRADVLSRMILGTPAYSAVHHYTQSQMTYEDVDGDCMVTQVSGPSGQDWAVSDENIPFILGFAREKGMGGIQVYEAGHLKDSSRLTVIARGGFIDVITPDTSPTGGAVGTGTSSNPAVFDGGPLTITDKTGTVCATAFPGKACASATLSGGNFDLSGSFVELVSSAQLPVSFASMQYYFNQLKDPANLSAGNTLTAVDREYQLISSAGTHVGSFIVAGKMTAAQMTALKSMLQNPVPGGSVKVRDNLTGSTSGSSGGTGTTGSSGGTTGGTTGGTATTGTSGGASVGNSSGTGTVNFDGKLPIIKDQSASVCATSFSGKRCASALITGQNYKVDVSFVELDSWAGLPIEFKSINTYFTHINQAPYLNNGDLMSPMNLEYQLISSGNAHVGSFIVQGHLTMAQRNELKSILEYTVPGGSVQIRDGNAPTTPASTATETESGSPAWADALIGIGSFAAVSAFVYGAYRWVRAADVAPPTVGGDPTTPQPPAPPAALAEVVVEFD
ncbi:hypothetical protein EBR96_07845, partial [bacterium]|nr:hypothetical protein [bacterium]